MRKPAARRWSVLLGVVGLLAGTGRAQGDVAAVGDVVGRPREEARAALSAQGFLVATYEVAGEPTDTPDTVEAQAPAAWTPLEIGSPVLLRVRAAAATPTPAPNAVGLSPAEASTAFGALYELRFEPVPGAPASRGKVVEQAPAMGQSILLRGLLTLRFVRDDALPPTATVPDVAGLAAADAMRAVGAAGLHARISQTVLHGAAPDMAVAQVPAPGTELERYATIDVIVAVAPQGGVSPVTPKAEVPNCEGLTESSAREEVENRGLAAEVEWVDGDPSRAFLVQSQDPPAGALVDAGTVVRLSIVRYVPPPAEPDQVVVPSLVGMSQWQAEDVLVSIGLSANPVLFNNPAVPPLRVFGQQIFPGTRVPVGTSITLRVAKPPPPTLPVPVPNFYGHTLGYAIAQAASAGLALESRRVTVAGRPPDRVFSQSLAAGSFVPSGTRVTVLIANRVTLPAMARVPDLIGRTAGEANSLLGAAGLSGNASYAYAPGKPLLRVYLQSRPAGSPVPAGSTISFTVSRLPILPLLATVPDLSGKTRAQAEAAVTAAGLVPQGESALAPGRPLGRVFSQSPDGGAHVHRGTAVRFKVAVHLLPAFVVVPDLMGKTKAQADAMLAAAGLHADGSMHLAPGKPPGRVYEQSPAAAAHVAPGATVHFKVAVLVIHPPPPALVSVPNLIGLTPAQANAALSARGLASDGRIDLNLHKPLHRVYSQNPASATLVAPGSTVRWKSNP